MGYQSKTYSLSDEVIEAIEVKKASGLSPDQFLWSLIFRKKKPSKREQAVAQIRASDPMSSERPEIEYGSDELPSGGSVIRSLDAGSNIGKASVETFSKSIARREAGQGRKLGEVRKQLLKPSEKK